MQQLIAHDRNDSTPSFPSFLAWVILDFFEIKNEIFSQLIGFSDIFFHELVYLFLAPIPAHASAHARHVFCGVEVFSRQLFRQEWIISRQYLRNKTSQPSKNRERAFRNMMRKTISTLWRGQLYNAARTHAGQSPGRKASYIRIAHDDLQRLDLF